MLSTRYWESLVLVSLFVISIWVTYCELNSFFFHCVCLGLSSHFCENVSYFQICCNIGLIVSFYLKSAFH